MGAELHRLTSEGSPDLALTSTNLTQSGLHGIFKPQQRPDIKNRCTAAMLVSVQMSCMGGLKIDRLLIMTNLFVLTLNSRLPLH